MPKKKHRRFSRFLRRGGRRRRSTQISIPLVVTGVAPLLRAVSGYGMDMVKAGDLFGGMQHMAEDAVVYYTGYDMRIGTFDSKWLVQAYVPMGIAAVVHQLLGKRINPQIAKIPMIGKYIGV